MSDSETEQNTTIVLSKSGMKIGQIIKISDDTSTATYRIGLLKIPQVWYLMGASLFTGYGLACFVVWLFA